LLYPGLITHCISLIIAFYCCMFSWFVVFPRFLTFFAFVKMSTIVFYDSVDFLGTAMWTVFCSHSIIYNYNTIYVYCQAIWWRISELSRTAWNVWIAPNTLPAHPLNLVENPRIELGRQSPCKSYPLTPEHSPN